MKAQSQIEYCIESGVANVAKHKFMSVISMAITLSCLLLVSALYILSANIQVNMEQFQAENAILAFVDDTLSTEEEIGRAHV